MSSHGIGALFSPITGPPASLQQDSRLRNATSGYELNEIANGSPIPQKTSGIQTSETLNDLETNNPPSLAAGDTTNVVQTLTNPPINKWRLLSCCFMCFANGLNDGVPGALIPYMDEDYSIGYSLVSLIFIANAIGFISAAPITQIVQASLGRAKHLMVAEGIILVIPSRPFPVVVLAFLLLGLGIAMNLAPNNVFCANLAHGTINLAAFHGSYATIGPISASSLVSHGAPWSTIYFLSLALAFLNLTFAYLTFRTFEKDNPPSELNSGRSGHNAHPRFRLLKQAIKNKTTLLAALFIFAYQGAEVSISGWVISFLISYRHSPPSRVGYVTAGFWGGITVGRFLLSHPAHLVGEKRAVVCFIIGAAAFQLGVWLVPNVIGEAVAVSIVGLLLGPIYLCATAVFIRVMERRLQITSLGIVGASGSSGGALAPFFTGLLAQAVGTWVLHPICIGLFVGMLGCWWALGDGGGKRSE